MEILFEMHQNLTRQGPGSADSTKKAFELLKNLPEAPKILDIGCGSGNQTITLAELSAGDITAIDIHQPFLDQLSNQAKEKGLSGRIKPQNMSMLQLNFKSKTFDLIWSEGAIYIMGFIEGLINCHDHE